MQQYIIGLKKQNSGADVPSFNYLWCELSVTVDYDIENKLNKF